MTARGDIVEGSLTDRALSYLRKHPGAWTVAQIQAAIGGCDWHGLYQSLQLLASRHRAERTASHPSSYRYRELAGFASVDDVRLAAIQACPLHAWRVQPRDRRPILQPSGMKISERMRILVLGFDRQRPQLAREDLEQSRRMRRWWSDNRDRLKAQRRAKKTA